MDKRDQSKKDEIILRQLEVIRTMTEHNLSRMGTDFWGAPAPEKNPPAAPAADQKTPPPSPEEKGAAGNKPESGAKAPREEAAGEAPPKEDIEDLRKELEGYVGLAAVKREVKDLINLAAVEQLRRQHGLPTAGMSLHMVFTGNPGTAKTTVARLFAEIMKDNGLLSKGDLYEVGRSDLVGKYVGWTAQIVKEKFRAARGSVLFIDEAYSLVDDKEGLYGDEAINTIVQEMENNRDNMVVIFAGYPDKMEQFLNRNPGLRSRIAFHVPFEDYSTEELVSIAELIAQNKGLHFDNAARQKLCTVLEEAHALPDFGNGRYVRNLVEMAKMEQANRLVQLEYESVTADTLATLLEEDIPLSPKRETPPVRRIGF